MEVPPKPDAIEVDVARYEVRLAGRPVRLERRPMELLILLAQRSGELVTRDEIIQQLWGKNVFLDTEHGINTAVRKIRQALRDDPERPRYLHTVVGKGYRLEGAAIVRGPAAAGDGDTRTAEVPAGDPGAARADRSRPIRRRLIALTATASLLLVLASAVAVVLAWRAGRSDTGEIHSIAVLPLQNLSPDPAHAYFADAMTEALITDLGQFAPVRVISRQSIMQYKDARAPLPQIARELGVDAVVEGSVQREGDHVRITAQLIHARSDTHLWARSYDRDLGDMLVLQNEVASAIVREIGAKLVPAARARLAEERRLDPRAYEAFLKGSYELSNWSLVPAIGHFEAAIGREPDYGPAYALMARAYYFRAFYGEMAPHEAFTRMHEAALKAVEKDESRAEAHGSLALVKLHYAWDFTGAEREFRRALELNPSHANIRHDYAHYLITMGRIDESVVEMERAFQLDPLGVGTMACHGWHLYSARRYDSSLNQGMKALQLAPDIFWTHIILGWAYSERGAHQEAIAALQNGVRLMGGDPFALAALGQGFAAAGKQREAEQVLQRLDGFADKRYTSAYDRALIHAALHDRDAAFDWLERAFAERSAFLVFMTWDPRADSLRADARFRGLLRRIGFPDQVIARATRAQPG
ncbi:MAG: winged helix-turn-helix domain-containing protein [Steroidobacteraceae bacterium]|nr:winged helix-turn-helix domain-containing protein [Steroidobacteraceae bacterium]